MLIPVLIVSSLVHVYSIGYMSHDPHNQRFFSYLSLFTFMMIILVTSNNYLLIIAANQSSLSAFLTNRVGDAFLTIDYSTVFSIAPYINENIVIIVGSCLLIGAMAKSSQIGPTPVSALIHAATMVTAGVYLLMRSSPLIEYSETVLLLCL
ncbi:NADH-ubiquinone oxidoreductase [Melampsora americana]|nr:NADH-ubiquinone oxidoreductase [Melampsora americana]